MELDFARGTALLKALSDESRVRIVHILSCGELCACDILDYFDISQPTLSHHLAILVDSLLVTARHEGKWTHYSLNSEAFSFIESFLQNISRESEKCLCKKTRRNCK
jgi:ArsR family transcriptional regulator